MTYAVVVLLGAVLLLVAGCSDQDSPVREVLRSAAMPADSEDVAREIPPRTIELGDVSYISLWADDSITHIGEPPVMVHALATDNDGQPLPGGIIFFEIVNFPCYGVWDCPSFDSRIFPDTVRDEALVETDQSGIATVPFFAGLKGGRATIRATSTSDTAVFDERRLILVVSGSPTHIDISAGWPVLDTSGISPSYILPLWALVWDRWTNPVIGYWLRFTAIPESLVTFVEDSVYIDTAWSITYHAVYRCENTMETLRLVAYCGDLVDTSHRIILPFYPGHIITTADPTELIVSPTVPATSAISAEVIDTLQCRIENGVADFWVTGCGEIGPWEDTTDSEGRAYATFSISYDQIPQDSSSCTAIVSTRLWGYPNVESEVAIVCRRVGMVTGEK